MNYFILMDAGLGTFLYTIVGPSLIAFVITGIVLIVKSIKTIRRELRSDGNDGDADTQTF